MSDDFEMCNNCKRDIPCSNYKMHTAHCMRNIALCPICDEPVARKDYDEHKETCSQTFVKSVVKSKIINTPKLGDSIIPTKKEASKVPDLSAIKTVVRSTTTTSKLVTKKVTQPEKIQESMPICKFCLLEFKSCELSEHENYCGSRTEQCPECSDYVMLKDWDTHQAMRLYHELAKKPCALVFGRDDLTLSSTTSSPWSLTPTTYGLTRTPSSLALSRRRDTAEQLSEKYSSSRRKYSEPSFRSQSLSRKSSLGTFQHSSYVANNEETNSYNHVGSITNYVSEQNNSRWSTSSEQQPKVDPEIKKLKQSVKRSQSVSTAAFTTTIEGQKDIDIDKVSNSKEGRGRRRKKSSIVDAILSGKSPSPERTARDLISFSDEESSSSKCPPLETVPCRQSIVSECSSSYFTTVESNGHSRVSPGVQRMTSFVDKYTLGDNLGMHKYSPEPTPPPRLRNRASINDNSTLVPPRACSPIKLSGHVSGEWREGTRPRRERSTSIVDEVLRRSQAGNLNVVKSKVVPNFDPPARESLKPRKVSFFGISDEEEESNISTKSTSSSERIKQKSTSSNESFSEDKAVLQNGTHWWSKATETSKEFVTKTTESSVRNGHVLKNSMDCDSTQSESASATRTAIKSNHSAKQHSETTRKYSESSLTSKYDFNQFMSSELQSSQSTGAISKLQTLPGENSKPTKINPLKHSKSLTSWSLGLGSTSCGYEEEMHLKRRNVYVDPSSDQNNREKLRQMLCNLRKDPMDEDLENNDGSFFPCEFCGDPYPVEFLMRHQLSCDLNPAPVSSGQGFDYNLIARRAAANIELARSVDEVTTTSGFRFE